MKFILILPFLLFTYKVVSQESATELNRIFEEIDYYNDTLDPQDSLWRGYHVKVPFSKIDVAYYDNKKLQYEQFISKLEDLKEQTLSAQESISKQLMIYSLQNTIAQVRYKMYLIPLNAEGGFYEGIASALDRLPFKSAEDYDNYLHWLPHYARWMEDHLNLMKEGIRLGIVAPKTVIENNISLLRSWLPDAFDQSKFYQPISSMSDAIDSKEAEKIRKKANKIITGEIIPAYKNLDIFLRTEYLDASPEMPGIMYLPGGKEYYENRVRFYTTLDITPDSVHAVGLQEVARIQLLMVEIIKELDFKGSFDEFYDFLRTDEQFYPKTPQELLNRAAWLSKKAEAQLPKFFKQLYSLPFTVSPVPEAIAPTYTAGRYSGGSMKGMQAGAYWVNTYKLESRTLYTLPALTLHEAVPGHHLQIALAQEITGIPSFRNNFYTSAFGEGWGLYSEYLGEEMGMYETPYERFGRYTYEMWRACRLVVDTGIHYKGWNRERALEYMKANTALSLHELGTEIDRYIGWPGQAVSYKIGELKIKALRKEAEDQLGEKFDIREFHYHILKNGAVTLPILQQEIDNYIALEMEK
jgi:uncharacterized protein (DUF885 family)